MACFTSRTVLRSFGAARALGRRGAAITPGNLNPRMVKLEYAVRGPLVARAGVIENQLKQGKGGKSFNKVIRANLGDAHAMGQPPITFIRQVIACISCPDIIDKVDFPEDVKKRARDMLQSSGGGSIGAYTMSLGIERYRRNVAKYIEERDGHSSNWENISITTGASTGIKFVLQMLCNDIGGKPTGVMIPIPQYPLYSASLAEFGLVPVRYYLVEEKNWGLDVGELERALKEAKNCNVRSLVVINPGNPTGQVLTRQNIEDVITFAEKHNLFIFADEVYQHNIYAEGSEFHSFKKVMQEMGKKVELASFMSVSKGYVGECGLRGGWMEVINVDPEVLAHLYKCMSAMLCPNTPGQAAVDCVALPPKQGEPSHDLWNKERLQVLDSLKTRARMVVDTFNKMKGFKCNEVQGAMYAFPRIDLPQKAIDAAKKDKKAPDTFYAFQLLEDTGICIVAGSGFGQRPGTYHFRTTILPQPALLQEMLDSFQRFHEKFSRQYS